MIEVMSMGDRLRKARLGAGFASARSAALHFSWTVSTYASHENGQSDFRSAAARKYAKAFRVPAAWLLTGEGNPATKNSASIIGAVGRDGVVELYSPTLIREGAPMPSGGTETTVALQVQTDALSAEYAEEGSLIYYDEPRVKPLGSLEGLHICWLKDGRVLVRRLRKTAKAGRFDLWLMHAAPIFDAAVDWVALVTWIKPG